MQNPVAFDIEYREHVRQMAWVNSNDWQFARSAKRHPVRQMVAKALIQVANLLSPLEGSRTPQAA